MALCVGLLVSLGSLSAQASPETSKVRAGGTPSTSKEKPVGFGSQVFGAKSAKPRVDPDIANRLQRAKGLTPHPGIKIGNDRLSFSGSKQLPRASEVTPANTGLPGRQESARHFEEATPTELHMHYKLDNQAAARVAVNPQDETTGTYIPLKKGETVSAAGVFLDVDMQDNVSFTMGGEVTNHQPSATTESNTSTGANLGMKFSF